MNRENSHPGSQIIERVRIWSYPSSVPKKPYESGEHKDLTDRIRKGLEAVGLRLQRDPSAPLVLWVMENRLAVSHRPLRNHPKWTYKRPPNYAGPLVKDWVTRIRDVEKIKSVICLLPDEELESNYGHLHLHPKGLLGYYESEGLTVRQYAMIDNRQTPFLGFAREAAKFFPHLPEPVLVHCAGGADRTPSVAALIALKCGGNVCI